MRKPRSTSRRGCQHISRWLRPALSQAMAGSLSATVIGQASTAGSGILAARMLGVQGRGYLALLILWPSILVGIGGAGLPAAVAYFVAQKALTIRGIRRLSRPLLLQFSTLLLVHGVILAVFLPARPRSIQIAGLASLAVVPLSL